MTPRTARHLLLTGPPGSGKTTVIERVVDRLSDVRLAGFYTREIRRDERRVGFEAIGFSGSVVRLAHIESHSPARVGKYGVLLDDFEDLVRAELDRAPDSVDQFVIDEIGKMECLSPLFVEAVRGILDRNLPLLATVALRGGGFIREVKDRSDVELLTITVRNRDKLPDQLAARIRH